MTFHFNTTKKATKMVAFFCYLLYFAFNALYAYALEKIQTILRAIVVAIDHALDTRLNDELRALNAGRSRNI